ncbi:MAG: hypothetical protein KKC55_16630 [Gammaproteobacteria bacterium]|uniref:Uncharacterized protein n=1 Tax=viral metagenome TaxID=1070528 RepID=A0A6M3MBA2_9ZZZZ|nr:hypothetical protein [Gammaproteobacteria bacterium]
MSTIDWSKAPEGATHFTPALGPNHNPVFWKVVDGAALQAWATTDELEVIPERSYSYSTPCGAFNAAHAVKRPVSWAGEGHPPVGTVCEFHGAGAACPDDPWHPDLKDGDHVTIIAYFNDSVGQVAAFTFKARNENIASIQVEQARPGAFRPIRTQEEIEAQARTEAIDDMVKALGMDYASTAEYIRCGLIYDAGYRKQVMP